MKVTGNDWMTMTNWIDLSLKRNHNLNDAQFGIGLKHGSNMRMKKTSRNFTEGNSLSPLTISP